MKNIGLAARIGAGLPFERFDWVRPLSILGHCNTGSLHRDSRTADPLRTGVLQNPGWRLQNGLRQILCPRIAPEIRQHLTPL